MLTTSRHALITGGAGFIGSHLAEYLLANDWRVTVLDDMSTGRISNIEHLTGDNRFRLFVGSAGDRELLRELAAEADIVWHLAAVVGVRKVMEDTVSTIERNLHTTENVLKVCNLLHRRVLLASTSEVYGSNPKDRFAEDDDSIIGNSRHRRWCYAAGKLMDEFHAYAYYHATALPMTIVRLFNTVGPRQVGRYGMVVPTFVEQALRSDPITVHGDGTQRRCFTSVMDVVRCLYELALKDEAVGEVFNIGSDREISIRELAETIKKLTQSDSPIVYKSYQEVYGEDFVDMERRVPDTTRLQQTIGFAPDTPLPDLLQSVIDDLRCQLARVD